MKWSRQVSDGTLAYCSTQLNDSGINLVGLLCINANYGWGCGKNVSTDWGGWGVMGAGRKLSGVLGERIKAVFTQGWVNTMGQPCRRGILSAEQVVSRKASAHVHLPVSDWASGLAAFCTNQYTHTFPKPFVFLHYICCHYTYLFQHDMAVFSNETLNETPKWSFFYVWYAVDSRCSSSSKGVGWGWGQGCVQAGQVLPYQTGKTISLWCCWVHGGTIMLEQERDITHKLLTQSGIS